MPRRTFADVLDENTRLWNENELLRSRIEWQESDEGESESESDSDSDELDDEEIDDDE